jgi:hypothetical protein
MALLRRKIWAVCYYKSLHRRAAVLVLLAKICCCHCNARWSESAETLVVNGSTQQLATTHARTCANQLGQSQGTLARAAFVGFPLTLPSLA